MVISVAVSTACKHDPEMVVNPDPIDPGDTSGNTTYHCSTDTIYFVQQVLPLLSSGCAMSGCHDANSHKEGVILDSYSGILLTGGINLSNPTNSKIYRQMLKTDEDRMPPPPAPAFTADQLAIISKWISQGAKETSCLESGCDTTNVTYTTSIKPMIQNNCLGCHNGTGAGGGISLATYAEIKTIADNGKLLGVIDYLPGYSRMPKNGNKLTDCQINMVKIWLNQGSPQN